MSIEGMKHSARQATLLLFTTLACSSPAFAQDRHGEDRTDSPYFAVTTRDDAALLPLEETRADVAIAGVIAHVRVTQVYVHRGKKALEAIYVFPGSTRAAVSGLRMKIGDRVIEAEIQKESEARKTYGEAKQRGQTASLLEQHRANVFQMSVANILPGDRIEVALDYNELIEPEDGVYALRYPTVVGPRYVRGTRTRSDHGSEGEVPKDGWATNPYLHEGEPPPHRFELSARITAGMPIRAVESPTHRISPRFDGPRRVLVEVDDEEGGDRDFVVRYRLDGDQIQTGLMLLPGKENYFLLLMQPPERPNPGMLPPREYVFVIDVSGSMAGFPIETAKRTMRNLLGTLRSEDRFNVLSFSGGSTVLCESSLEATSNNIERALEVVDSARGAGSTEILGAIRRALSLPRAKDRSTSIIVITDGYVTVEKEVFGEIRSGLGAANLFAFGVGAAVNHELIEGMARAGLGHAFVVSKASEADEAVERFRRYVESPLLTHPIVTFDGFDAYDVEPEKLPDMFASRPIALFGKYRGSPGGKIVLRGTNGEGKVEREIEPSAFEASDDFAAIRWLWARHRISRLADDGRYDDDPSIAEEITRLGLEHGLMTAYTSFVAVDSRIRRTDGTVETVRQPLPLPRGVEESAVSGRGMLGALGGNAAYGHGAGRLGVSGGGIGVSGGGIGGGGGGSALRGAGGLGTRGQGEASAGRAALLHPGASARSGAHTARVAPGSTVIMGSLSKQEVAQANHRRLPAIRSCYERRLLQKPELRGRILVSFSIDPEGRVSNVEIQGSTLADEEVERCVASVLRSMIFPKPSGGGTVAVRHPFVFAAR